MKAIGYQKAGALTTDGPLEDIEVPTPELRPHDVLVQVKGISINPVDSKIRTYWYSSTSFPGRRPACNACS